MRNHAEEIGNLEPEYRWRGVENCVDSSNFRWHELSFSYGISLGVLNLVKHTTLEKNIC